jgi:hypothetical protein
VGSRGATTNRGTRHSRPVFRSVKRPG